MAEPTGRIHVGAEFVTLNSLIEAMQHFEVTNKVTYWRRDTRTLTNARKRGISVPDNPEIVYYSLIFACNSGGREFKSKSTGKRPQHGSFRKGCGSQVSIRATKDASKLVIVNIVAEHNHEPTEETFQYLPKCRKLNPEQTKEINTIIKTKPNKKILQHHIRQVYGKTVTLKDLANMSARLNNSCSENLEVVLSSLCSKDDTTVEIVTDNENTLRAIYYQDCVMKEKFNSYPEVLMADATYKLNNFRMPVFIQLIIDGNGESEIVSAFVIVTEDKETLECLVDMFKKHNPAWESIKSVLTDKDKKARLSSRTYLKSRN